MPGPGTSFLGPVLTGTVPYPGYVAGQLADMGLTTLTQQIALTQNGTAVVSGTIAVPQSSQIIDIIVDTTTAWNSGSADVLSVGTAAAGTTYASGVSVASAARVRPTFTSAQLAALLNTGTVASVVASVTPTGTAATTGATTVTLIYAQTVQSTLGIG